MIVEERERESSQPQLFLVDLFYESHFLNRNQHAIKQVPCRWHVDMFLELPFARWMCGRPAHMAKEAAFKFHFRCLLCF